MRAARPIPQFICIAGFGYVPPKSAAAAMAPHGRIAGSASVLLRTLQFVVGAIAGMLGGAPHNGTALPMAGVIAGCGVAALLAFHTLAGRPVPRAAATEVEKA